MSVVLTGDVSAPCLEMRVVLLEYIMLLQTSKLSGSDEGAQMIVVKTYYKGYLL